MTVGVVVGRLGISDPLPEETALQCVILDDLGKNVAYVRHVLVGVETLASTSRLKSTRIEYQRSLARAKVAEGRDLRNGLLADEAQASIGVAHFRSVYLVGIGEHVWKGNERIGHDGFIGHRWTEDVSNRARPGIRLVPPLDRSRIWHLVAVAPPQADWELLQLALIVIANKDLRVVADAPVPADHPLPVVLAEDFGLSVVIAARGVRICVWTRKQLHQGLHVGVNASGLTCTCTSWDLVAWKDQRIN